MSGVEIRVRANAKQAQQEIRRTGQSLKGLENQAAQITKTFQRMALGLTAVFAGTGITRGINSASDAMTSLNNRVNLVTRDAAKTSQTVKALFDVAARSGGSIDAAAETFNRFGLALRDGNKPVEELLKVTEAVQKAAVISGSGAESAKAAIVQLGQGLASGQLRGQELNSVLEQMPRLAQAIAEGMEIPFGKLREEAMAGRVTADAVYDSLLSGAQKINDEFATLEFTTGEFATVMQNELTRAIAEFDKVAGFSDAFKDKLLLLTNAFRFVGENIEKWSLQAKLAFLIVESQAKDFFQGFKDLFSREFDASAFANGIIDSIISTFEKGKSLISEAFSSLFESQKTYDAFGDEIEIEPRFTFSTAGMFTGITAAVAKFTAFKDNVIEIFEALIGRLFINSAYTGMFFDSHKEPGQKMTFGTDISTFLKKPLRWFTSFKDSFIAAAIQLNKAATEKWAELVAYFETVKADPTILDEDIKTAFDNTIEGLKTSWGSLVDYVDSKKPKSDSTFTESLTTGWDTAISNIETRWGSLIDYIDTKRPTAENTFTDVVSQEWSTAIEGMNKSWKGFLVDVGAAEPVDDSFSGKLKSNFDAAIANMGQSYDNFVIGISDEDAQTYPTFDKIKTSFTAAMDAIKNAYNVTIDAIAANPVVILIKSTAAKIAINFEDIKQGVEDYFEENQAALSAAVSAGLALVFKPDLLKGSIRKGIIGGLVAAAALNTDDAEFMEAVRQTGKGWGEAFRSLLSSGEGGILSDIIAGISSILKQAGEGLVDGFFGEDFDNKIADNIAAALLAVATGFVFAPTLTKALFGMGGKVAGFIFGDSFKKKLKTKAASAIETGILELKTNPKITKATDALGDAIGKNVGKAMKGALVVAAALAVGLAVGTVLQGMQDKIEAKNSVLRRQREEDIGKLEAAGDTEAARREIFDQAFYLADSAGKISSDSDLLQITGARIADELQRRTDEMGAFGSTLDFFGANLGVNTLVDALDRLSLELERRGVTPTFVNGEMLQQANGGYISGPGTGTSDDIPALLSNGEYVIKASAVKMLGKAKLNLLNQGILPRFSQGGFVGKASQEIRDSFARGDTKLAMEMISVLEQLGKLDETMAELTEEMQQQVKKAMSDDDAKEREKATEELKSSFNQNLSGAISEVLHTGDWKGVMHGLLDTVTSSIINNFASGMADAITKDIDFDSMFKGLTDIFNMGGAAGSASGLGGIFSSVAGWFGFSQGGIVPNTMTSQAGKDSVPAMLTPGEVVLSKNDVARANNNQSTSQSFNINITGDVSRQTRQEIVKMIPQITSGVNSQNKEANYRR